jgi:hypothetical protein
MADGSWMATEPRGDQVDQVLEEARAWWGPMVAGGARAECALAQWTRVGNRSRRGSGGAVLGGELQAGKRLKRVQWVAFRCCEAK